MTLTLLVPVGTFLSVLAALIGLWNWRVAAVTPRTPVPRSVVRIPAEAGRLERFLGRLTAPRDEHGRVALEMVLTQAGFPQVGAPTAWLATRTLLTFGLPVVVWLAWRPEGPLALLTTVGGAAALGYYLPYWAVLWVRRRRQRRIRDAVPNLLDMLVSCVEAGLSIDIALRHVSAEIDVASTELADELAQVNAEIQAGVPRVKALDKLEMRTGVSELGALAQTLGVVERFGSGIAQSLRAHAHLSRRRRALKAEQRAATASPALTIVMVLFILPSLFVVLMGPMIVRVASWLFPGIEGGTL